MHRTLLTLLILLLAGCGGRNAMDDTEPPPPADGASFADDLAFLQEHGPVQVLAAPNGARVALSADYQGRVMTSAVAEDAPSLGWIHRDFIAAGEAGTAFDNYGGEDRFWLGPEGGQYGLYFPPDSGYTFAAWQVPPALQEGAWEIRAQADTAVTFARSMRLANHSGTTFELDVERTVRLLTPAEVEAMIGEAVPADAPWVGYETINRVTNTGTEAWTKDGGMPSIWILSMFNPFDTTYAVVPFDRVGGEVVVNDDYFGEVPAERLRIEDNHLVFLCDGQLRSKIGLGPSYARPVMGSYTPSRRLLTLVQFTLPEGATDYVNSMWEEQAEPYGGDVVNSYNDGPVAPGQPALGGFYELESSSPALALAPGESHTHVHRTLHVVGDAPLLDRLAGATLGVPVSSSPAAF